MKNNPFKLILTTITCVLVLSMALFTYVLYHTYTNTVEANLKQESTLIATSIQNDKDYLKNLNVEDLRITVIKNDGTVLFDNTADVSQMENHSDRPEVRKAILDGEGEAIRTSTTLAKKTIYYATLLENGNVLRLSKSYDSLFLLTLRLASPVLSVLLVGFIASIYLNAKLSK